jgi:2-polyprenyl-6-methoxyphenol hydroxylase-like FAD-dependent oxidoreductase
MTEMDDTDSAEVLVAGAGPVGLTLAVALGKRGVRTLLVERDPEPGILPKMDLTNARSMEIYRRLGLAEKIRSAGWPLDAHFDVYVGPSLAEPPYDVLSYLSILELQQRISMCSDGSLPREPYERISQYTLEALLLAEVRALPSVTVRFGHELTGVRQLSDGVRATIRSPGGRETAAAARYLAGCDGGHSSVRSNLGIRYSGPGGVGEFVLVFFRCPGLLKESGLKPFRHYVLVGDRNGALVAQDDLQRWALHLAVPPGTDIARLDAAGEVRAALGIDLDIEVLHFGSWTPRLLVADRYSDGRVFLAGDAVHQYIPAGGFGLNTGIADADNLAWKLDAVLRGWGGPGLLESYNDERQPVGARNMRASEYAASGVGMWRQAYDDSVRQDTTAGRERRRRLVAAFETYQRRSHEQHGTEMGYRYTLSAVINHEAGRLLDPDSPVYTPSAAPGSRLPHAWVSPGLSVHDRIGTGMTLLALDAEPQAVDVFRDAARAQRIPLDIVLLRGREDLRRVYGAKLLLVRPDLHVGWRGDEAAAAAAVLATCTGNLPC